MYHFALFTRGLRRAHGRAARATRAAKIRRYRWRNVFTILAIFAPVLCRADTWMLSTSDFQNETVVLYGLNENGVAVITSQPHGAHLVPFDRFLEISRSVPIRQHPSPFMLRLRNGDLLAGEPVSLSADSIVWREDIIGNATVSLRDAVTFLRSPKVGSRSPAAASDDCVKLANGDAVHGVLSDLTGSSVSIQPAAGGDATAIPIASVSAVEFASLGNPATTEASASAATASFRIHLADESVLTATAMHGDDWTMHLSFSNGPARDVPLASIQSIEQINGPVIWLSSIAPSENVQTSYLETQYPARFDRTVLGGPIQFADRTYTHGIGVHAYSRMSWTIATGNEHFRTQYAVDGDSPYARMTIRIKLDGEVVHERKDFHSGELSPVVNLVLKGKHQLTLEAADDTNEGVQARLNWIEPAFVQTFAANP